jgi:hypothetical protein
MILFVLLVDLGANLRRCTLHQNCCDGDTTLKTSRTFVSSAHVGRVEEFHNKFAEGYSSAREVKFWGMGVGLGKLNLKCASLRTTQITRASDSYLHC